MFGASFSVKASRDYGYHDLRVLEAGLKELGIKRLRLMSYWNEIEGEQGSYDFKNLDEQLALAKKYGAEVTLCLGVRQPRWPEMHLPDWAKEMKPETWEKYLYDFIKKVMDRYKADKTIVSWQLENEALNRGIGLDGEYTKSRIRREYILVKELDGSRPVIMSTSNSWGIPFMPPIPDIVGFSLYKVMYGKNKYDRDHRPPSYYRARAVAIRLLFGRKSFIHELQLEPWGPRGNSGMSKSEQYDSMPLHQFHKNILFAKKTKLYPIDTWGLEWWYWMKHHHNDPRFWNEAHSLFQSQENRK